MRKSERRSRRQRRNMSGCFRIFTTSRRGREALARMVNAATFIGDIVKSGETDDPIEALEMQYHAALVLLESGRTNKAYVIARQIAQKTVEQDLDFDPHKIILRNAVERYNLSAKNQELLAQSYFKERARLKRDMDYSSEAVRPPA